MKSIVVILAFLAACGSGSAELEQKDLAGVEQRLDDLEDRADDVEDRVDVQDQAIVSISDQVAMATATAEALTSQASALEARIAALEANSGGGSGEDYSDEIAALQVTLDDLQLELASSRPVSGSLRERLSAGGPGTGSSWEAIHTSSLSLEVVNMGPILVWCHLSAGSDSGGYVRLAVAAEDGTQVTSDYWGRSTTDDVALGEELTAFATLTPSAIGAVSVQCQGQNTRFEEVDLMAVQLPE